MRLSDACDSSGTLDQVARGSGLLSPAPRDRSAAERGFSMCVVWEGEQEQKVPGAHRRMCVPSLSASVGERRGIQRGWGMGEVIDDKTRRFTAS